MRHRTTAILAAAAALAAIGSVVVIANANTASGNRGWEDRKQAEPMKDDRDQYALVAEIIDARTKRNAELAAALDAVRASWLDHRYEWEVALVPALCRDGATCVAMPFDHLRSTDRPIIQGWLPRLQLDEAEHAALLKECQLHDTCVFTFEGRLDRLVLTPEDPTSVGFTDVKILSTRAARASESWIRRPRAERADPNVGGRRTGKRAL